MTNREKYNKAFIDCFSVSEDKLNEEFVYQCIPAWDSVGHMGMIAALEDTFDIMMDIDDFKNINDELGHQYGDKSLITITQICRQEMRATDEIARYGGDEFIILLPETSATNAFNLAERICNNIADYKCLTESGESCTLSASLGVAEFDGIETLGSLLHRADQALYEAKHAGKGQVKLI